jgi:riboflavin synthase
MFTGLVETTGKVVSLQQGGRGLDLLLRPSGSFEVNKGDSVCVNGVCLTVVKHNGEIGFNISPETLKTTNLGSLRVNDIVNLERALRVGDRIGGHIVTGHVDGTGTVVQKIRQGEYTVFTFETSREILKYIIKKGSVAVDGISLTVVDLEEKSFRVAIIPHTLAVTNLSYRKIGDTVNIEVDIIGKYIEKFIRNERPHSNLMDLLKEEGFIDHG